MWRMMRIFKQTDMYLVLYLIFVAVYFGGGVIEDDIDEIFIVLLEFCHCVLNFIFCTYFLAFRNFSLLHLILLS